jgi:ribosomal protein S18 acetylase RimI-like enzyme
MITEAAFHLRPICEADMPLLQRIYASTRAAEMAAVPWDAAAKSAFVQMQFDAQHKHYSRHYADAQFCVAEAGAGALCVPVGRLYVWRRPGAIHVVEITILPEFRQRGYGTQLLQTLQREAAEAGGACVVSIHVEHGNPALSLYQRLGFQKISENGMHDLMEWRAAAAQNNTPEGT